MVNKRIFNSIPNIIPKFFKEFLN